MPQRCALGAGGSFHPDSGLHADLARAAPARPLPPPCAEPQGSAERSVTGDAGREVPAQQPEDREHGGPYPPIMPTRATQKAASIAGQAPPSNGGTAGPGVPRGRGGDRAGKGRTMLPSPPPSPAPAKAAPLLTPCRCPAETGVPKGPGLLAGEKPRTGYELLSARGLPGRPLRPSPGRRWTQSPANQS